MAAELEERGPLHADRVFVHVSSAQTHHIDMRSLADLGSKIRGTIRTIETMMTDSRQPEPWLRETLTEVPAVCRAVLHALQLAEEDLNKFCGELTRDQVNACPGGVASVAFQIRHIARSIDRLLTYAEGQQLDEQQMAALHTEMNADAVSEEVFNELHAAIERAGIRIRKLASGDLETARLVGRKKLPTTLGGLLVHVADHTQRHVGQAITTAKLIRGMRVGSSE